MTGFWNKYQGIIVTLVTLAAIESLSHTAFRIPNPPPILMLAIIVSAYLCGTKQGLISAVITWLYSLHYFAMSGRPLHYTDEDFHRIIVLTFVIPATAILVGFLKRKADKSDEISRDKASLEEEMAERIRVEEKLRDSEGQLRAVLENAGDAIIGIRPPGLIFLWNKKAEEIYGYSRTEAIGRYYPEIIVPERYRREALHGLERFFESGAGPVIGKTLAHTGLRKDGTEFPVELTVTALQAGEEWQAIGIVRDSTERKKADNLISVRLQLSQVALSHSLDELLQATIDEVEKLTNSRIGFYHFLEADQNTLSLQMWSTRTLREMCKAEGKSRHYAIDQAGVWVDCVRERRPVIHNDYSALPHKKGLPSGHADVIRELVVPVFRGDRIVAILGVGNKPHDYDESDINTVSVFADLAWDIAERKQAEEALIKSDARFQSFMRNFPGLAYMKNIDGRVLFANEGFSQFLGLDPATMPGKTNYDLFPAEFAEKITRDDRRILESGRAETVEEVFAGRHWVTYKFPIPQIGSPPLLGGLTIDITERKKMEDEIRISAMEWSAAMDASRDVIYLLDPGRRVLRANKAFYSMTRSTPETATGRHIAELVHPGGEKDPCPICLAQEEKRDFTLVMEPDHPDNPAGKPIEINLRIIRDNEGSSTSMLMTLHDLTHDRAVQEELTQYRMHLEELVRMRTAELQKKTEHLERLNRAFVERELRMRELKERIKELEDIRSQGST